MRASADGIYRTHAPGSVWRPFVPAAGAVLCALLAVVVTGLTLGIGAVFAGPVLVPSGLLLSVFASRSAGRAWSSVRSGSAVRRLAWTVALALLLVPAALFHAAGALALIYVLVTSL